LAHQNIHQLQEQQSEISKVILATALPHITQLVEFLNEKLKSARSIGYKSKPFIFYLSFGEAEQVV
jgi:hypothetical protein